MSSIPSDNSNTPLSSLFSKKEVEGKDPAFVKKSKRTSYEIQLDKKVTKSSLTIFQKIGRFFSPKRLAHKLAGRLIIASSNSLGIHSISKQKVKNNKYLKGKIKENPKTVLDTARCMGKFLAQSKGYQTERISIEVDGISLDACLIGHKDFSKDRWTAYSGGNNQLYEHTMLDQGFYDILKNCQSNAIVFNYPGSGNSQGSPSRELLVKAHQAVLKFLEEKAEAKEIISYGHSIGGGIQLESLATKEKKEGVEYLAIHSRSFSQLASVIGDWIAKPLESLAKKLNWSMTSDQHAMTLADKNIEQIVLQAGEGKTTELSFDAKTKEGEVSISKKILLEKERDKKIQEKEKSYEDQIAKKTSDGSEEITEEIEEEIKKLESERDQSIEDIKKRYDKKIEQAEEENITFIAQKTDYAMQKSTLLKGILEKSKGVIKHNISLIALKKKSDREDPHNARLDVDALKILKTKVDNRFSLKE